MQDLFTRRDWQRLPEGFPAELVGGVLLKEPAPSYGHQSVQMRLLRLLAPRVPDGCLLAAPADVVVDEFNIFQPDIVVLDRPPEDPDGSDVGIPRIALEVLSPETAARDRDLKAQRLLDAGVAEVWLVDPEDESVTRLHPDGSRTVQGAQAIASEVLDGFQVVPQDLFLR